MRIPFWQRDQAHPTKAIDRLQSGRAHRRLAGMFVAEDFSRIVASLVQVRGSGKHARFREIESAEVELESSAVQLLQELRSHGNPLDSDLRFASLELASYQTHCFRELVARSGTNRNDIIALGVLDPGIQVVDFEEQSYTRSLTDANELAHRTGMNVIDRFQERDIADGGSGESILALGYWFLLGDRNPKVAEENRVLIRTGCETPFAILLPASDGLDATLPAVRKIPFDEKKGLSSDGNGDLPPEWLRLNWFQEDSFGDGLPWNLIIDLEKWANPLADRVAELKLQARVSTLGENGLQETSVDAVATAFLANAFIDQLPASLPDLTGNPNPRVLGSLTPGSMVNLRNLTLEISKVTPSIMKLRDAI